jgi:hypothetical protein
MKKQLIALALGLLSLNAYGFNIYALGTSNINCKGADQAFTNTLGDLFVQDKSNVKVINGGKDGDVPLFMLQRLEKALKDNSDIKIVIFEPGPNERNKSRNLEPSEKILAYLQKINMPTIYVSHVWLQNKEEAQEFATKYGAYYYGHWVKDVPTNTANRQYDQPGLPGHMTVVGCQLWANNMFPFVKEVMKARNIQ